MSEQELLALVETELVWPLRNLADLPHWTSAERTAREARKLATAALSAYRAALCRAEKRPAARAALAAQPPRPIHELLDEDDLAVMAEDNDWAESRPQP